MSSVNWATAKFCGRCGHVQDIHDGDGSCSGIHVVGEPNTMGADQPCNCQGFELMDEWDKRRGQVASRIATNRQAEHLWPDEEGFLYPLIMKDMEEAREAEGPRPTAAPSLFRGSDAMRCARDIGFRILETPEIVPVPPETLMAFDVGQRFHERIQQVAKNQMGAWEEVICDLRPEWEMSTHADLVYTVDDDLRVTGTFDQNGIKVVVEIKSISGYGFLLATGQRKAPSGGYEIGPKPDHITQAAFSAMGQDVDAKFIHMIYVDKDKGGIAEWMLPMDLPLTKRYEHLTPRQLAEADLTRMAGIGQRLFVDDALPARHIPGVGRVENPPDADSKDQPWNCRYCRYQPLCKQLPATPTPLDDYREALKGWTGGAQSTA